MGIDRLPGYEEIFEQRGRRYDDAMARWPHVRDQEFAFVVGLAAPVAGEVLVDIPSGGGYLAAHLPAGVVLVARETSPVFAERALVHGVATEVGDLEASGAPAASCDVLVSVAGIHHHADHPTLLASWVRLLRPGGRLVVADVVQGSAEARFLDGFVGAHTSTGHAGSYLGDGLAGLGRAAGLVEVATVDEQYHWWADTEADLAGFCTELFGLEDVDPSEVLAALAAGPGIDHRDGRVGLRWGLRALVGRSGRQAAVDHPADR